jgi:hypothetical protein
MYNLNAYQINKEAKTKIEPLETNRDWMKDNFYAYNCFPITMVNKLGFAVSLTRDVSFMWHGYSGEGLRHDIEVFEGEDLCYFERGGGVIGFPTDFIITSDENVSLLTMPVPNQFTDGIQAFSSIISSSFYTGALHVVCKITSPNKIITIKAGTPIAAILPISLGDIQDSTLKINNWDNSLNVLHAEKYVDRLKKYGEENNRPAMWYQKAVNQNGEKIGSHEVQSIKLHVENENVV